MSCCCALFRRRWRLPSPRRGAVVVVLRHLRPPLAGSVVPASPRSPSLRPSPLSSVAYVVPLPVAACVSAPSPFPQHTLPPATLSHRRPGAAGTTLHVDGLGSVRPPALLPPRRVFCSRCTCSHTRTLSLSHTRTHSLSLTRTLTLSLSVTCEGPLAQLSPVSCARSVLGLAWYRRRRGSVVLLVFVVPLCHAGCLSLPPCCPHHVPPPVPVPCCPTVPWRRAVLAAAVGVPVLSVASAAPGEVPPGHVPLVSRAVVVCRGGRADRQLVEAGHGVPVEESLDVPVRLEL